MKRLLTLVTGLILILPCIASPLTPQQALERVQQYRFAVKSYNGDSRVPQLVMTGNTTEGVAAYYVFSNASSTLFVSADDLVRPLLGYTDSGNFDPENMPPQMKWWLESYAKEIEWATRNVDSRRKLIKHNETSDQPKPAITPMLTTVWSQHFPFNMYCPELNDERTVTGCVATSMAQVMNYHQWPQSTVNSISYNWNGKNLTSPSVTLEWDYMLDSYKDSFNTDQADAVARLMQVAGYSVAMQYNLASSGGSGAYSMDIRTALVYDFGYDIGIDYLMRDFFTAKEWEQKIYDNLVNVGPVIYDGRGTNGGHSFVCDGFDGNGSFHINWGWGGVSDGYFVLSALNPEVLGTGGGDGGFNYNQGAVLGIQRPQSDATPPVPYIVCSTELEGEVDERYVALEATDDGGFWNYGSVSGYFVVGAALENLYNGEVTYIPSQEFELQTYYGVRWYWIELPDSIQEGCYRVRPMYTVDGGDWMPVRFREECTDSYIISVTPEEITIIDSVEGDVIVESWHSSTGFVTGKPYQISLTVSSTYKIPHDYYIDAYICESDGNNFRIIESLGSDTITIPAVSTVKMEFSDTLSDILPGNYYLVFAQDKSVVEYAEIEVTDGGEFTCKGFNLSPDTLTPGMESEAEAIIASSFRTEKTIELNLSLCTSENDMFHTVHSYGNETVTIDSKSEQSVSYTTVIPQNLSEGTYYLVLFYPDGTILDSIEATVNPSVLAVDTIDTDQGDSQYRYYNLQGIEINASVLTPGIYIRHNGGEATKILIK